MCRKLKTRGFFFLCISLYSSMVHNLFSAQVPQPSGTLSIKMINYILFDLLHIDRVFLPSYDDVDLSVVSREEDKLTNLSDAQKEQVYRAAALFFSWSYPLSIRDSQDSADYNVLNQVKKTVSSLYNEVPQDYKNAFDRIRSVKSLTEKIVDIYKNDYEIGITERNKPCSPDTLFYVNLIEKNHSSFKNSGGIYAKLRFKRESIASVYALPAQSHEDFLTQQGFRVASRYGISTAQLYNNYRYESYDEEHSSPRISPSKKFIAWLEPQKINMSGDSTVIDAMPVLCLAKMAADGCFKFNNKKNAVPVFGFSSDDHLAIVWHKQGNKHGIMSLFDCEKEQEIGQATFALPQRGYVNDSSQAKRVRQVTWINPRVYAVHCDQSQMQNDYIVFIAACSNKAGSENPFSLIPINVVRRSTPQGMLRYIVHDNSTLVRKYLMSSSANDYLLCGFDCNHQSLRDDSSEDAHDCQIGPFCLSLITSTNKTSADTCAIQAQRCFSAFSSFKERLAMGEGNNELWSSPIANSDDAGDSRSSDQAPSCIIH